MVRNKLKKLTVEELANTLTHGFGLLLSVAGFVFLVVLAAMKGDGWYIASSVLYGLSLIVLYAASTFYHGATSPELKRKLQIVDHCCIYVLIAGTYTPFTLVVLRSGIGQNLFIFVWCFAVIGILSKILLSKKFRSASVVSYLVMGWIGVIAASTSPECARFRSANKMQIMRSLSPVQRCRGARSSLRSSLATDTNSPAGIAPQLGSEVSSSKAARAGTRGCGVGAAKISWRSML